MIKAEDKLAFWSLGIMIFVTLFFWNTNTIVYPYEVVIGLVGIIAMCYFFIFYPLLKFLEWVKEER